MNGIRLFISIGRVFEDTKRHRSYATNAAVSNSAAVIPASNVTDATWYLGIHPARGHAEPLTPRASCRKPPKDVVQKRLVVVLLLVKECGGEGSPSPADHYLGSRRHCPDARCFL